MQNQNRHNANAKQGKGRKGNQNKPEKEGVEKIIQIDRINKVVKGGKRLSFRAFVITGDLKGKVGFALGKAKEVPMAIRKGVEKANRHQVSIETVNDTIPHEVIGKFGSAKVVLRPAKPGTGVIAGGAVRILLEAIGIKNIVAKTIRGGTSINSAKAAMNGLLLLRNIEAESKRRGIKLSVFSPGLNKRESKSVAEDKPQNDNAAKAVSS